MNLEPFEIGVLAKIIDTKEIQHRYLKDMITFIFSHHERRYINYIMKRLYINQIAVTRENIYMIQKHPNVNAQRKRFQISKPLTMDEIENHTFTMPPLADAVFDNAFQLLHDEAFLRFAKYSTEEMELALSTGNRAKILTQSKAILKYNETLYAHKTKKRYDAIGASIKSMRDHQAYQPTSSYILNSAIGGWSKGFVGSMIGKPSHGKSTFMTWDSITGILKGRLDDVTVISPEEPEDVFWRRVFSTFLKVPMHLLRDGSYTITKEQEKSLKKTFEGKLNFYEVQSLRDIVDLTFSLKSQFIWLDHINVVSYPRNDAFNGIIELVNKQKEYLRMNKDTVIVDLSQPNTKEMIKKSRLVPQKEDAYNSSILEQAAREFLTIYYPYVDGTNPEVGKLFAHGGEGANFLPLRRDLAKIYVSKNSNGTLGEYNLKFHNEIGSYEDMITEERKIDVIMPEELNLGLDL